MDAVAVVRVALGVITERLITILGLSMSFTAACWTLWDPTWNRVATLAIFVVFSYLVIRNKESRNARQVAQEAE